MKIVAFSDMHGQHSRKLKRWFYYNPGDLLLFAGDLQLNNHDNGENFIEWIHDLPYTNKVMVFGNHDGNYMHTLDYVRENGYSDITFLMNSRGTIGSINIFGSPYSVVIPNHSWWFSENDEALEKIWRGIPTSTNILLTHCPPLGILDRTIDGFNVGSESLSRRIKELPNLKYHIFGHIQEAYGVKKIGNVTYINASLLNEKYSLTNLPIVFDFEEGTSEEEYNIGE
jgi:Icc-related predicted phosphoesterase